MEQGYLEEVKNKFVQDFRDGIYSERKQEIWLKNELNRNSTMCSNLMQFFSKLGYLVFGVLIGLISLIVGQNIQKIPNPEIEATSNQIISPWLLGTVLVIMVMFVIALRIFADKQKEELNTERLMVFQTDSEIKKEIQRLTLLENNKSSKVKK